MSLINEALKKAQRQRGDPVIAAAAAVAGSSAPIAKREPPRTTQTMLILGAGGVLLVVLSAVGTAYWLSRPAAKPSPVVPVAATTPQPKMASAAPALIVPAIPPPTEAASKQAGAAKSVTSVAVESAKPANPPTRVEASHPVGAPVAPVAVAPAATAPAAAAPASAAVTPAPTAVPPPPKSDERIHQFVDALRVTGIRSSGSDSKVLMNDRVYRLNDIVDRALGLRLTKVAADSLTFTDANGVNYVKYF